MPKPPATAPLSAEQRAFADWEAGTARYLTIGLLRASHPRLHRDSGLYVASMGCVDTEEFRAYVQQYNAWIQLLREESGLPSWAPGSRFHGDVEGYASLFAQNIPKAPLAEARRTELTGCFTLQ